MDNNNKRKFEVNIEDDGFLNPEDLDKLTPPVVTPPKKKFEVHIDDSETSFSNFDDQQPRYNGEIYFSNRKPAKRQTQTVPARNKTTSAKNNKTRRAASAVTAVFCVVVIIFSTAFSAFAISCINDILAFGRSEEKVQVNIPNDATTDEIIDILSDNDLIKQKTFCKIFYKVFDYVKNINKKNKPADPVYFGDIYYVQKNLGLEGYLTEFKQIAGTADTVTLVFPEGWTLYQIFDKIDEFGVCSKSELLASVSGADFDYDFIKEIGNVPNRTFTLEGYLYPDTYEFYEKSNANGVLRKFLDTSESKWTEEYEAQREKLGMTRDEIIIIASIIQREAANKSQMGLVSSVLHNRLSHPVSWPLLGCDSTKNYVKNYIKPNTTPDKAAIYENYYDTYISQGLPPGPICNPGDDAIKAALFPDDTDYYYFRHDKYGEIYMAKTQTEHDRNGIEVLRVNSR